MQAGMTAAENAVIEFCLFFKRHAGDTNKAITPKRKGGER